jgi:hypothetical protein
MVTIVAWFTCWYMSMSDQRTGTGVMNRSDPSVLRASGSSVT